MRNKTLLLGFCLIAARVGAATDPCGTYPNFDTWAQCRLAQAISAQNTQSNPTKQADGPAISTSSTSLVDHTSLADFATVAVSVAGYGKGSSETPAANTTVSAYAVFSALTAQNPLDPQFYNAHAGWRQVTFSVGTNAPATGISPAGGSSITATTSSRVVGAAYLVLNHRDLAKQLPKITRAAQAAGNDASVDANYKQAVAEKLYAAYTAKVGVVPVGENPQVWTRNEITTKKDSSGRLAFVGWLENDNVTSADVQAIVNQYAPEYQAQVAELKQLVGDIQNAFQFSVSGQAAKGDSQAQNSDYRGQIVLEKGAGAHFNFTANGSFDYINTHRVGADTRGGRAATDLQYLFSSKGDLNPKEGVSLDLNGEADWFQSFHPSYVGQVKLTIPLVTGVALPLSFSYASSANLLHEAHLVGKFGLTFDLSKIAAALSKR